MCEQVEDELCIGIQARGTVIPEEAIGTFFEVLSIPSGPISHAGALGFGPPVAERIIKLFGGSVKVENQDPLGVLFSIMLKRAS